MPTLTNLTDAGLYVHCVLREHAPCSVAQVRRLAMAHRFDLAGVERGLAELSRCGFIRRHGEMIQLLS